MVILPERRWTADGVRVWRRAEELGFAHAWTYDHLAWRTLRDSAWFGAVPTLAAAAAVTPTIRLGTLVASPTFRHPVPFARELLALDDISDGRFTFGVGAGGDGWDTTILGQAPLTMAQRMKRFEEFVELTHLLLTEREVSYEGEHYAAVEARSHPGCVQQPRIPFAIAATGPRGMRLVARYGAAWVTTGVRSRQPLVDAAAGAADITMQSELLHKACESVGRDPATVSRVVVSGMVLDPGLGSPAEFEDTLGRYADVGVTDFVVHWPRAEEPFAGDVDRFEAAVSGFAL